MPKTVFGGDHTKLVEALIAARKAAGLTQVELASRIGRVQTFVSLIENGQRRVDVIEFIKIAEAIGVEPTGLLTAVVRAIRFKR